MEDRECVLFDGTKLFRWDKYDYILSKKGSEFIKKERIFRVSESFRVIATCCPPNKQQATKKNWLSEETLSLFTFHYLNPLQDKQKSVHYTTYPSKKSKEK